ncbi:MAG: YjbQ family protein, partial [Gammaproteobacteria bacterium]|nr:YjbQ family protein [Gammaproteobacteria bacterium]
MVKLISISVNGQGLHNITREIENIVCMSEVDEGICNILIQHTSASLTIQ